MRLLAAGLVGLLIAVPGLRPLDEPATPAPAPAGAGAGARRAPATVAVGAAPGLDKIDRSIRKEPAYKGKPKYCLLAFGPRAEARAWLALDGDTLYVDRNGNRDLTEAGASVRMPPFEKTASPAYAEQREVKAGAVRDGPLTHTNLVVTQLRLRQGFKPKTPEEAWFAEAALANRDGFAYFVSLDVQRCSRAGKRLGRVRQLAWEDEGGLLHFAGRPQDAPVIHFGGPLRVGLLPGQALVRGGRPAKLICFVGTQGWGKGTFATLYHTSQPGLVPEANHPLAEVEFPAKAAGGVPVRAKAALSERC
jgi:hypothetical protein